MVSTCGENHIASVLSITNLENNLKSVYLKLSYLKVTLNFSYLWFIKNIYSCDSTYFFASNFENLLKIISVRLQGKVQNERDNKNVKCNDKL